MGLIKVKYPYSELNKDMRYKAWLSYFVLRPIIVRTSWFFGNFTPLSAEQINILGSSLMILSGWLFYQQQFALAGIVYIMRSVMDHVDGRVARMRGTAGLYGAYLDNASARWAVFLMISLLTYGQVVHTGDNSWIFIGMALLFANWNHAMDSMKSRIILGDKFQGVVKGGLGKKGGKLNQLVVYLKKHDLAEPLNSNDWRSMTFFAFPIIAEFFGHFKELMLFAILTFLLKEVFWAYYYRRIFGGIDKIEAKKRLKR